MLSEEGFTTVSVRTTRVVIFGTAALAVEAGVKTSEVTSSRIARRSSAAGLPRAAPVVLVHVGPSGHQIARELILAISTKRERRNALRPVSSCAGMLKARRARKGSETVRKRVNRYGKE